MFKLINNIAQFIQYKIKSKFIYNISKYILIIYNKHDFN